MDMKAGADTEFKADTIADLAKTAGLYAAGGVANAGLFYQEYPAYGTSNSMSMTNGFEAGKNAAKYSK